VEKISRDCTFFNTCTLKYLLACGAVHRVGLPSLASQRADGQEYPSGAASEWALEEKIIGWKWERKKKRKNI